MEITRRKFFFFGLAAGVGLLLPDKKIELPKYIWDKTRLDVYVTYMHPKQKEFYDSLAGIPYHENNASSGVWLGQPRGEIIIPDIREMINTIKKNG